MSTERRYLSTSTISRALGVSVSTVKRWVDEGVLPAWRTAGGHRKVLPEDVLRVIRRENLPHADLTLLGLSSADLAEAEAGPLAEGLFTALRAGDAEACRALLSRAYEGGMGVDRLADEVIAPAMAKLGHQWEEGEIDVWQEHRGTQVCLVGLADLQGRLVTTARRDRSLAVGGGPEDDPYLLANVLIQMLLADLGWEAVNLGPNTPLKSLRKALGEFRPRLMWLSCSYLAEPERFLREYAALFAEAERLGVAVAVGGQALTEPVRKRMRYTTFGDGLGQLAAFARTLSSS
jgi:excisionase family DNA binding protein